MSLADLFARGAECTSESGLPAAYFYRPPERLPVIHGARRYKNSCQTSTNTLAKTANKIFCKLFSVKTYSERLVYAMGLRGKKDAEVAEAAGVKWQAIQHLRKATNVRGSKHTAAIAAYLGVSARWLAEGHGARPTADEHQHDAAESSIDPRKRDKILALIEQLVDDQLDEFIPKLESIAKANEAIRRQMQGQFRGVAAARAKEKLPPAPGRSHRDRVSVRHEGQISQSKQRKAS